jgi:hypothetical protein
MKVKVITRKPSKAKAQKEAALPKSFIYVLELEDGCVYVGKTSNVKKRLLQHVAGTVKSRSAAFTRLHKPTGKLLKRLGDLSLGQKASDGPERDETLRWMKRLGPQKVRGWKYVRRSSLNSMELREIESNMRELFDLCRTCGKKGHFASKCTTNKKPKKNL